MKILAIYQSTGHGSGEFTREAKKAAKVWHDEGHTVWLSPIKRHYWRPWKMRKAQREAIANFDGVKFDAVAFFCHGTWKKLKLGWHIWNVGELAALLGPICAEEPKIILYACSCGSGKREKKDRWNLRHKVISRDREIGSDGFCFMLGNAWRWYDGNPVIFGHSSAGHTTMNPYMFRFDFDGVGDYRNGVVKKSSSKWDAWYRLMRSESSTLRYRFPFMSDVELGEELER